MKVLIQNYNSVFSNEAVYLNNTINNLNRTFVSRLWNLNQASVFDTLDTSTPDILICHVSLLSQDILKYLKTEKGKAIKLILNITGNHNNIDIIEQACEENQISPLFLYSNEYKFWGYKEPINNKFVRILPAANIEPININCPDFHLKDAIISPDKSNAAPPPLFDEICSNKTVYHKIKLANEADPNFDIIANITSITGLYSKYDNITIIGKTKDICEQLFFDAILKSNNLIIKTEDQDNFTKFLEEIFTEEVSESEEEFKKLLKNQILKNHTSINRTHQLLDEIVKSIK